MKFKKIQIIFSSNHFKNYLILFNLSFKNNMYLKIGVIRPKNIIKDKEKLYEENINLNNLLNI